MPSWLYPCLTGATCTGDLLEASTENAGVGCGFSGLAELLRMDLPSVEIVDAVIGVFGNGSCGDDMLFSDVVELISEG